MDHAKIVQDQLTDEPGKDPTLGAQLTDGPPMSETAGPRKGLQRNAEAEARQRRRNKERKEARKLKAGGIGQISAQEATNRAQHDPGPFQAE